MEEVKEEDNQSIEELVNVEENLSLKSTRRKEKGKNKTDAKATGVNPNRSIKSCFK